eukprot:Hpha_TRINITY_DN25023_c0_g1::TRINITY_DN25023_c0_g1_i1::g.109759::m.109759/K12946/SPCS1; signal peptidase complex subunit 1
MSSSGGILFESGVSYEGQRIGERIITIMLWISGVAAVISGFIGQSTQLMMAVYFGGAALCWIVVVPPWKWWPADKIEWVGKEKMDAWLREELKKEEEKKAEKTEGKETKPDTKETKAGRKSK